MIACYDTRGSKQKKGKTYLNKMPLLAQGQMRTMCLQNHTESQNVRGWKGPLWVI